MKHSDLTTKPIAFLGDIHGHWRFVEKLPELLPEYHWIFVGDFVDSFSQSISDQIKCIVQVLDWVEEGKASSLYGNHELSYWFPEQYCSGYKAATQIHMTHLRERAFKLMKTAMLIDNTLVTHAGLTRRIHDWMIRENPEKTILEVIEENQFNTSSPLWGVGKVRGGRQPEGGIWWCDWAEEFEPVPGLNQVFGHSNVNTVPIRYFDEEHEGMLRFVRFANARSYNIDCLARNGLYTILTYDKGQFGKKVFGI